MKMAETHANRKSREYILLACVNYLLWFNLSGIEVCFGNGQGHPTILFEKLWTRVPRTHLS